MFKKFLLGYLAGLGIMHYYLTNWNEDVDDATEWASDAASDLRHDATHEAAEDLLKDSRALNPGN